MILAPLLAAAISVQQKPLVIDVYVVNFDPVIEAEGGKRLHEVMGWNDPRKLARGYFDDIQETSGGFIRHRLVRWDDRDEWPIKKDGFRYTDETYLSMWRGDRKAAHNPDEADYEKIIRDNKMVPMVDSGKIDEFWIFGFPYSGFWESAMAGPGSFFINGGVYDKVPSKKPFVVMGFSFERGVAEMIHNLCHRAENHLSRVYGGWNAAPHKTAWDRFSAHEKTSPGRAGVGNCHFPPNAEHDYDYKNPRKVASNADAWLRYPKASGGSKQVDCETWGGPDYQRDYLKWWYTRLPKAPGLGSDGKQANWWKYIFDFNGYTEHGEPNEVAATAD